MTRIKRFSSSGDTGAVAARSAMLNLNSASSGAHVVAIAFTSLLTKFKLLRAPSL
jgi:hypothetical protein